MIKKTLTLIAIAFFTITVNSCTTTPNDAQVSKDSTAVDSTMVDTTKTADTTAVKDSVK